jgi:hypothetical protein
MWHTISSLVQAIATSGFIKPTKNYVLTNEEKNNFLQIIKNLKTPTSYVSSLKKKVYIDGEMKGMKSHDYHLMMQEILPLCM